MSLTSSVGIFPLGTAPREAHAVLLSTLNTFPPDVVLIYIERARRFDPNSPSLIYHHALNLIRKKDIAAAEPLVRQLEEIGPNWEETRNARRILKYVREGNAK